MAPRWHADEAALARVVGDLLRAETAALRPGLPALAAGPWDPALPVGEDGLGLDSLERLSLAGALTEALHLHESGIEDLLLAQRHVGGWLAVAARGLRHFDARLTFRTSGSSGAAKPCVHALDDLAQEIDHLADLLAGCRRVVSAVPAHHIYGFLFTVLLPHRLDIGDVLDARALTPQAFVAALRPGDLVVSHPAHLALLARHGGHFPAGVRATSSTAPCPDLLAADLLGRGLQRLLQVYGSSETAGIGWRDVPGGAYRLMPFWSRAGDGIQRLHADGSMRAAALQDRLAWQDNACFQVAGRLDSAVQVAGHNVFPAEVRQVLCAHPEVAEAAVRLMAPNEGQRLKAFVVARDGAAPDLAERLAAWAAARLPACAQPRSYRFGAALPCNAQGKACDWALVEAEVAVG